MDVEKHSLEKDLAFEHIEATNESRNPVPEILRGHTPEQLKALEKKLVRKIDFRALPILIVLFLLNVLDRNAIANARLGGLEATLGIDDVQYQTAVMVLWAGYISMMIPSNMLLSIFKPKLYLPTVVIIWGAKPRWIGCAQVPGRCNGSTVLSWMHLLPLMLVYKKRATKPHCYFLLWIYTLFSLWWVDRSRYCRWHGRPWWLSELALVSCDYTGACETYTDFVLPHLQDLHLRRSSNDHHGLRWVCSSAQLPFEHAFLVTRRDGDGTMATQSRKRWCGRRSE